ncbi:MAG: bifunctional pyr operon transcriptional regulator/uracil phosphoribosyltransferase PyrR [Candidatus Polarisedimenticolaceae bacterium]|nr:bifunctional pyr operon transcriptional regulator/uracil phosphoribosyltransferase PyrR [Candidatus Polarisedimenticolaceae bacterium]
MSNNKPYMQADQIDALIDEMAQALKELIEERPIENPLMIGIHTGGIWLAERLHQMVGIEEALGTLDITFYRDDFSRIGMNPEVQPSHFPFDVDDRNIILVDDVLCSGRTIRAALNEIFDYGRPASVALVTLVDRSGRELPFEPAVSGLHIDLQPDEHITLTGPEPLQLVLGTESNRKSRSGD